MRAFETKLPNEVCVKSDAKVKDTCAPEYFFSYKTCFEELYYNRFELVISFSCSLYIMTSLKLPRSDDENSGFDKRLREV